MEGGSSGTYYNTGEGAEDGRDEDVILVGCDQMWTVTAFTILSSYYVFGNVGSCFDV